MNLFDYIKYQGTNIISEQELLALPPYLIDMFYRRMGGSLISYSSEEKCLALSTVTHHPNHTEIFHKALKEYCEDEFI